MSNNRYFISLPTFKSILESRDKTEVIGVVNVANNCLLANIIKEIEGEEAKVGRSITTCNGWSFENPPWVSLFLYRIDLHKRTGESITVEEALEVVNSIEE